MISKAKYQKASKLAAKFVGSVITSTKAVRKAAKAAGDKLGLPGDSTRAVAHWAVIYFAEGFTPEQAAKPTTSNRGTWKAGSGILGSDGLSKKAKAAVAKGSGLSTGTLKRYAKAARNLALYAADPILIKGLKAGDGEAIAVRLIAMKCKGVLAIEALHKSPLTDTEIGEDNGTKAAEKCQNLAQYTATLKALKTKWTSMQREAARKGKKGAK